MVSAQKFTPLSSETNSIPATRVLPGKLGLSSSANQFEWTPKSNANTKSAMPKTQSISPEDSHIYPIIDQEPNLSRELT